MGIGESPLLDSHRREKRGRHCHQLDDRGWQPQRPAQARLQQNSLPPGTEIVVEGYQGKDHGNIAVGKNITFPDGKRMLLGGSANEPTDADKK